MSYISGRTLESAWKTMETKDKNMIPEQLMKLKKLQGTAIYYTSQSITFGNSDFRHRTRYPVDLYGTQWELHQNRNSTNFIATSPFIEIQCM